MFSPTYVLIIKKRRSQIREARQLLALTQSRFGKLLQPRNARYAYGDNGQRNVAPARKTCSSPS
ncbi:hypothetical protein SAMN05216404_10793 [Nitrosospira multiformis]|uniref:Uncharacterized protein n=1 Tax=Nitrosospira multiformis TaxID=1231 RepID=A0A1H8JJ14_9PROT|nr:hypothetical protein SAMN05216404_10793 [Nitrosospira multiformis]